MEQNKSFADQIIEGYSCKGEYITLGSAILDGVAIAEVQVKILTSATFVRGVFGILKKVLK